MHVNPLVTQQLHASSTMLPAAPIFPEQGSRANLERVQQHTHPAWFRGSATMPLTLLAELTTSTVADASGVDQSQAPISFPALFGRMESLPSWTMQ